MEKICEYDKCFGCFLCEEVCPKNAIKMEIMEDGFYHPRINKEICIDCKICEKQCISNNHISLNKIRKSYYGYSLNDEERISSSSGGIFSSLANYFLDNGGLVVGAYFKDTKLVHEIISSKSDLTKLKKSKYIQSNLSNLFKQIKKNADLNTKILFVSVPCQVAALKKYLGKEYSNVLYVDLVCHGVGSTTFFQDSIKDYEKKYSSKVLNISFRDKYDNWTKYIFSLTFSNGQKFADYFALTPFGLLFSKNLISRESCYSCYFANSNRIGDITLGDFGGDIYNKLRKDDIKKGVSTILVNSKKGENIINKIKNNLHVNEIELNDIILTSKRLQGIDNLEDLKKRDEIISYYLENGYEKMKNKYCLISNEYRKQYIYSGKWLGGINQFFYKIVSKLIK